MDSTKTKVIVYHAYYGCETGCCGHIVEVGDEQKFYFDHPYGLDKAGLKAWAEDLVRDTFGEEHVADLDWENCVISDD